MENNSKKLGLKISIGILVLSLLGIGGFFIFKKFYNPVINDEDIIVTSKYGNITLSDMKDYLANLGQVFKKSFDYNKLGDKEKDLIVKQMISEKKILIQAKKDNLTSTAEYKKKLLALEENLLRDMFLKNLIKKELTEENILIKYNEMKKFLVSKKEYKIKHIVVKTEEEINIVISELKNSTFEDLAKKYSIDEESKENGGNLGFVLEGNQNIKEIFDIAKNIEKNKLSEPFKSKFGWHVLIKEDERDAVLPNFEESKSVIVNALTTETIKQYINENIKDADIKILK